VTRRARWSLPGLISEDLSFASLHEPLEPRSVATTMRATAASTPSTPPHSTRHERGSPAAALHPRLHATGRPSSKSSACSPRWRRRCRWRWCSSAALPRASQAAQLPLRRRVVLDGGRGAEHRVVAPDAARRAHAARRAAKGIPAAGGVAGLSLGGALSATLTCLEPGFAFSAPFVAHMDLGAARRRCARARRDARRSAALRLETARFQRLHDPHRLERTATGDPDRTHLPLRARDDHFFRASVVRAMWRRWGKPRIHWYPTSHMGFIAHLPTRWDGCGNSSIGWTSARRAGHAARRAQRARRAATGPLEYPPPPLPLPGLVGGCRERMAL